MSWFVYMLECRNGSLYTGVALDVEARFQKHLQGKGARYTRANPPLRVLLIIEYADRSAALKAEYAIKQLPASAKWALARSHPPGPPAAPV